MPDERWVIWSEEHRAWWRPNSMGYTPQLRYAGRYTEMRAKEIVRHANMDAERFNEVAFELPDDFDELTKKATER